MKSKLKLNKLTPEEIRIILEKGTEPAFRGEYWNQFTPGIYVCRQCGLPLFSAQAKFEAGCGWPSFSASYPLAVKELLDTDAERTEIQCARCGGHLGHVFRGEKLNPEDTRHCANSLSIRLVTEPEAKAYLQKVENQLIPHTITVGGGCFWCIEAALIRLPGVLDSESGYAGGNVKDPSYEEVASGKTGHIEVTQITYDTASLDLKTLLTAFFKAHDPTSKDRQDNDIGSQYRSVIFYRTKSERELIEKFIADIQKDYSEPIVTEIRKLEKFYPATAYHQRYFEKHPEKAYCRLVIRPKIAKLLL